MNKERGFTLVELAIVLVVIGLILGAVFMLRDTVITNAKTTDAITLVKDLTAAINDFKSRYHYLPGDMPMAGDNITNISATCNIAVATASIGNGRIDTNAEIGCVAEHLVRAGLIKGDLRAGQPNYGIYTRNNPGGAPDVLVLALGQSKNITHPLSAPVQNLIEISNLPCETATVLDLKLDDGSFATGKVTASVPAAASTCTVNGASDPVPYLDIAL